jgi:ribosomal protein S20
MSRLEQQDTRDTITVRIDAETKDEYQDAIDESMSQDLRDYIKTVIETSDSTDIDRSNKRLRQAHQFIQKLSDEYDSQTLDTDIVESQLAAHLNIDKHAVRQGVLHELQDQGLIKPLWGKILVIQE